MNKLLTQFRETCTVFYSHRKDGAYCWQARQEVYKGLLARHQHEIILRNTHQIKQVLDKIESELRGEIVEVLK